MSLTYTYTFWLIFVLSFTSGLVLLRMRPSPCRRLSWPTVIPLQLLLLPQCSSSRSGSRKRRRQQRGQLIPQRQRNRNREGKGLGVDFATDLRSVRPAFSGPGRNLPLLPVRRY